MIYRETELQDAWLIELEARSDARGMFARSYCRDEFAARGLVANFVQQNLSGSVQAGTVRGMHYQRAPFTEAKLVRCIRGAIMDVIVDLRGNSRTYLRHQQFELSAENKRSLYVPPGFAHGFQSLTPDVEVTYLVSAPYSPEYEGGVRWSDPGIDIKWPLPVSEISDKDANWPLLEPGSQPVF
jgi:dTDP-4-dehydrorhamnose 3,5-epimerase